MLKQTAAYELDAPPAGEEQADGFAMFSFAWRQKWLVLLFTILGGGLGYLVFLKQEPVYEATAQILLVKPNELPIDSSPVNPTYDATHEVLLVSPLVIGRAVASHGLNKLSSLSNVPDPVAAIGESLKASRVGENNTIRSDVMRLSYRCAVQQDCRHVLEAMIAAYRDFLGATYRDVGKETTDLIVEAKDQLDRQITELEKQYRVFRNESQLLFASGSGENVHESRLRQVEQARAAAVLESSKLEAQLRTLEAAVRDTGGSRTALHLLVGRIAEGNMLRGDATNDQLPSDASLERDIFSALLEEHMLLERFGPDHPKVKAVRSRIELTREHMTLMAMHAAGESGDGDFLEAFLQSLRKQIELQDGIAKELTALFEKERENAKSLTDSQLADETFRSEITRKQRLFDSVLNRLEEIKLTEHSRSPKVESIAPAGDGQQISPQLQRTMSLAIFLGLCAGLGLAYIIDCADRSFRNANDITACLGLPIVAHIPVIPGRSSKMRPRGNDYVPGEISSTIQAYHRPGGHVAEAYRAVRTALYFSMRSGQHQVTQVTSPQPSDGKSTVCGNLAVSIAQSGTKVVLVDADFRRPSIHRLFGVDNSVGITSVLKGAAEPSEALQSTQIENLSLVPCGPVPANPAELLMSRAFEEYLQVLRQQFEVVLIDTAPVLAVTDPVNVAQRADGVLLVVRLTRGVRDSSRSAIDALKSVGVNVTGIIVNRVGDRSSYGGRGYRYTYDYRAGQKGGYYNLAEAAAHDNADSREVRC